MFGFDHPTILSPSFHGLRKESLAQWTPICEYNTTKNKGRYFQKNWVPTISDQNLWFSLPYFRPEALEPDGCPELVTSCYDTYTVGVNIKREMVLSPNGEEVASSKKNIPNSRLEPQKAYKHQAPHIPIQPL